MGKFILSLVLVSVSQVAFSVNKAEITKASASEKMEKSHASVTTRIAEIAHSDVQVRQLMKMFSNKKINSENYYEEMQKLQSSNK